MPIFGQGGAGVDQLAVFDDVAEPVGVSELGNVGLGLAIKNQDVGKIIGFDAAQLAFQLERPGALFGGAVNRLQGRHTQIFDKNLKLAVVPVTVRRQTEAALAAGRERYAGVKGRAQGPDALGDFGTKDLPKVLIGTDCGTKVCQVGLKGEGGHQRHFAIDDSS